MLKRLSANTLAHLPQARAHENVQTRNHSMHKKAIHFDGRVNWLYVSFVCLNNVQLIVITRHRIPFFFLSKNAHQFGSVLMLLANSVCVCYTSKREINSNCCAICRQYIEFLREKLACCNRIGKPRWSRSLFLLSLFHSIYSFHRAFHTHFKWKIIPPFSSIHQRHPFKAQRREQDKFCLHSSHLLPQHFNLFYYYQLLIDLTLSLSLLLLHPTVIIIIYQLFLFTLKQLLFKRD